MWTERLRTPEEQTESVGETAPVPAVDPWWVSYGTRLLVSDVVAVALAVFIAYSTRIDAQGVTHVSGAFSPSYLIVSVLLMWTWIFALVAGRTEDRRVVGSGPAEYQRVVGATWRLFAAAAVVACEAVVVEGEPPHPKIDRARPRTSVTTNARRMGPLPVFQIPLI